MDKKLLDAEWVLLRVMWGRPPQTMREIIANVQKQQSGIGWHYKTYHSYLRNMLEKGLIGCEDKNLRDKLYFAVLTKREALRQESETVISRISSASAGALVAAIAQSSPISDADKKALLEMAERLEQAQGGERP